MKKLLKSFLVLALVLTASYGVVQSGAWFTDEEVLGDNTIHAGTIDIEAGLVNAPGPFRITDMKPSTVHYMEMDISNSGENEADIWKKIVLGGYSGGTSSEPERAENTDNCIGGMIHYDMQVNGDVLISEADGYVLDPTCPQKVGQIGINNSWIYLGRLLPGESMFVDQSYHMDANTGNWAQGDEVTFDVVLYAQQIVGGAPSPADEVLGLGRCEGDNPGRLEMYNIGTGEDASHALSGWSDAWVSGGWGGNYGGGSDDNTFRLLMGRGSEQCQADDTAAEFTMPAGDQYAVQLTLNHLDGSQDDSFDLYVKIASVWTKFGHYEGIGGGENWKTTTFNLPQPITGNVEFKLVATQPANNWCANWGQVAFSWAELVHSTCQE